MTLTDAGPLVALVDRSQPDNARCRASLAQLPTPMVTTWPAFAEAMYLLGRIGGWPLQRNLWQYVVEEVLEFYALTTFDQLRMKALMEQYRDRPMDMADASLVAAAEATGEMRIFTIDRDFYIYQRHGSEPFEVIP